MADGTALERATLTIHGDRAELTLEDGHITLHKEAATVDGPTSVTFAVDQVRGAQVHPGGRGERGWLHLAVVGGSPAPPTQLAAIGDPYTLPLTGRSGGARRLCRMVERHLQERGLPPEIGPNEGHLGSGVSLTTDPGDVPPTTATSPPPPPPPPPADPPPAADPPPVADVPPTPSPAPSPDPEEPAADAERPDLVTELRELADLHDRGVLTDEEFERAKRRVIG